METKFEENMKMFLISRLSEIEFRLAFTGKKDMPLIG